jgi:hypothetical protein
MLLSEVFTRTKSILASGKERDAYFALMDACEADAEAFWNALCVLDAITSEMPPDHLSFLMWADGARYGSGGFTYHYDRKLPEVLAALSTAARRAMHAESGA